MRTIVYIDGQNFLYKVAERLVEARLASDKSEIVDIDIPYLLSQILPDETPSIRFYGVARIRRQNDYSEEIRGNTRKIDSFC